MRDYWAVWTLASYSFYSNLLNLIDPWKASGHVDIVAKTLKLFLLIGNDQGGKMLEEAMGLHGQMWLSWVGS